MNGWFCACRGGGAETCLSLSRSIAVRQATGQSRSRMWGCTGLQLSCGRCINGTTNSRRITSMAGRAAAVVSLFVWSGLALGEPLKIGVLTDMSGVIADTVGRGSVIAAELAVSDAGGTVLNRPVEIVSADHQLKPDVGLTIARRWFDEEHVEAIADIPVSTIALGVQNLAHTKGKIALISGAGTLDLYGKSCSPTGFVWTFY